MKFSYLVALIASVSAASLYTTPAATELADYDEENNLADIDLESDIEAYGPKGEARRAARQAKREARKTKRAARRAAKKAARKAKREAR